MSGKKDKEKNKQYEKNRTFLESWANDNERFKGVFRKYDLDMRACIPC